MYFGKAVLAFDCNYNRSTTEGKALFFSDSAELQVLIESIEKPVAERIGCDMLEIAKRRYTWSILHSSISRCSLFEVLSSLFISSNFRQYADGVLEDR